jgi:hypothetical protein
MTMRERAVALTATVLLLGAGTTGLALAPAANADASTGYVDGRGQAYDDWQDEDDLGPRDYADSNATALWQTVLYADGARYRDRRGRTHTFEEDDIDGRFGPVTKSATHYWQRRHGLQDDDGIVTAESWEAAQQNLEGPGRRGRVVYHGDDQDVRFVRDHGAYWVRLDGDWVPAYYEQLG